MTAYGNAFKTIRLIKDIRLQEAANGLGIDERSLRDIESGKTKVVSERFDQMLQFYNVASEVVFELASGKATFQNIIHDAQRDAIVVNQGQTPQDDLREKYVTLLEKQVEQFQAHITELESRLNEL